MSPHTAVLVHHPELDDFLFAAIGEERNGMSLTMVSVLGRLGLDPWLEAGRLSEMSKSVAAQMVAPMIARQPEGLWASVEAQAIANRLVKLLPQRQPTAAPGPVVAGARKPASTVLLLLCAGLLAIALLSMAAGRDLSLARFLDSLPAASSSTDQPPPGER
jgi:hypothetical protein